MPNTSLEAVTGRLGVGAIAFLGMYLAVDGLQLGVFELVEIYGKSVAWGILGVVPTIVVTYIVGVFCFETAELALSRSTSFRGPSPEEIIRISKSGSAMLQQRYSDELRNHELLKGASVSFVILSLGALAETPNMHGYSSVVWLSALGAIALSVMSLLFARRAARRGATLAQSV